jgi:hypothetical protein
MKNIKNITKIILALATVAAVDTLAIPSVSTQEVNLDTFCRKFPLNSRCENYKSSEPKTELEQNTYEVDRLTFCDEFPLNSQCQQAPLQVIKLKLDGYGEDDEWVLIDMKADKIKLALATKEKNALVSGALNGAIGALVPFPLPFDANKYNWQDNQIMEVEFKSNNCKINSCVVTGENSLTLPKGTNIHKGSFTINYQEKDLKRSVSFKIPPDLKVETPDNLLFKHY